MTEAIPIRLPAGLRQIAEVAGIEIAVKLAIAVAPERLHVPKRAHGSRLEAIVGREAAEKIVAAFGGERIDIPLGKRALALHLLGQGVPVAKVAKLLKMARRSVQYLKNGSGNPDQLAFPL